MSPTSRSKKPAKTAAAGEPTRGRAKPPRPEAPPTRGRAKPPRPEAPPTRGRAKPPRPERHVVLFVPGPEERPAPAAAPRSRVAPWPCAGRSPGRTAHTAERLAPPLELEWRVRLAAPAATSPVVSEDGAVYVADREGELRALSVETGETVFRLRTDPILGASPAWPLVASGIVPGDRVPVSSPPALFEWHLLAGDDEGIFYCVRRGDGQVLWRKAAALSLGARRGGAYLAPLVWGESAIVADADGNLHAASARSGATLFSRFLRGRPQAPPALADGRVLVACRPLFAGEPPLLHAVAASSGERLWTTTLPGTPGPALLASEGLAVVGGEAWLAAFEVERGELRWRAPLTAAGPLALGSPGPGALLHAPVAHGLAALRLANGEAAWSLEAGSRSLPAVVPGAGLAVAGGVLWVAAPGALAAFEAATGAPLGRVRVRGAAVGGPVAAAGRVLVATDEGEVASLRPA